MNMAVIMQRNQSFHEHRDVSALLQVVLLD